MNAEMTTAAIQLYMDTMTERELRGYAIAENHLSHSFKIEKSVGFQKWLKENTDQIASLLKNLNQPVAAAALK